VGPAGYTSRDAVLFPEPGVRRSGSFYELRTEEDVVRPYGEKGVVRIAETAAAFVEQLDAAIAFDRGDSVRSRAVDALLKDKSWDRTWEAMDELLQDSLDRQTRRSAPLWLRAFSGLASARRVS
jgi:hypothetical protein